MCAINIIYIYIYREREREREERVSERERQTDRQTERKIFLLILFAKNRFCQSSLYPCGAFQIS